MITWLSHDFEVPPYTWKLSNPAVKSAYFVTFLKNSFIHYSLAAINENVRNVIRAHVWTVKLSVYDLSYLEWWSSWYFRKWDYEYHWSNKQYLQCEAQKSHLLESGYEEINRLSMANVVVKHNGKFPSLKKSSLWNCFNKDRSQLEENLPSSPIVVSEKRIVLSGKLHFTWWA